MRRDFRRKTTWSPRFKRRSEGNEHLAGFDTATKRSALLFSTVALAGRLFQSAAARQSDPSTTPIEEVTAAEIARRRF
jgi:hypothetical protein